MKAVAYLVLVLAAGLPQTNVQVDVVAPADTRVTIERTTAPYTIVLTNNTTHDITGLVVEWAAGGPPQTLLLGHYGFKQPVVRVKGLIVLRPPNDITVVPVSMDRGRRIVGPAAPPPVWRVAISVPTVLFDDGTMLGVDRYELVRTITARTELPAALAAAEKRWAEKKPDV